MLGVLRTVDNCETIQTRRWDGGALLTSKKREGVMVVWRYRSCVVGTVWQCGFPGLVFCLNWIRACFVERGLLSACLGFFDLRVFPLGSAWKIRVLEIVGLDFESVLIMGDLSNETRDSALRTVSTLSYILPNRPRVFDSKSYRFETESRGGEMEIF